jgi:hypothetical protein
MAHFAEIDDNNTVLRIIVIDNANCIDDQGNESEQVGIDYCTNLLGGRWLQCSYNTRMNQHLLGDAPFRGNFPGIGFTYDPENDVFLPPKVYKAWVYEPTIANWVPPFLPPAEPGKFFNWSNEIDNWVETSYPTVARH